MSLHSKLLRCYYVTANESHLFEILAFVNTIYKWTIMVLYCCEYRDQFPCVLLHRPPIIPCVWWLHKHNAIYTVLASVCRSLGEMLLEWVRFLEKYVHVHLQCTLYEFNGVLIPTTIPTAVPMRIVSHRVPFTTPTDMNAWNRLLKRP